MSKTTTPDLAALVVALREAAEKSVVQRDGGVIYVSHVRVLGDRLLALLDAYAEQGRKLEAAEVDRKNEGVARFCDAETIAELMESGARTWMPIGSAKPVKNGSIIVMTSDDEPVIGQAFWHHDPKDNTWDLFWGAVSPDVEPWNEPIRETNKGLLAWQPLPEGVPAARMEQLSRAKEATSSLMVDLEKAREANADQAATIAALTAEVERLRTALDRIAKFATGKGSGMNLIAGEARAALTTQGEG